jgi:[ribosomal protein S18]-alanine N-acetyltransferase
MHVTKIPTKLAEHFIILTRVMQDFTGPFLLREWKQTEKENIVPVRDSMLPEIFRIQSEGFKNGSTSKLIKYSKNSRNTFYVIKNQDRVVGYCAYYLKLALSLKGFEKQSVISSIATDMEFRGKGFAERLLNKSIEEMKLNGISSIFLFVNINNKPAIHLYEKIGFRKIKEVKKICGLNETCYKMELKLTGTNKLEHLRVNNRLTPN